MKKITLALCILCTFIFSSAQAKPQKRTVTIWSFAANNCEEWKRRKDDIDKKFNVDLQIELVAQNRFVKKLYTAMSEDEDKPDIIEWMIENNRILSSDPAKSLAIPLNKYISKSMLNNIILSSRLSWVSYSNNIYGLPHDVHPAVLVYNDTIWKRVGVDLSKIETWDEFFEESKKLQKLKRNGQQVHFALPFGYGGLGDSMFMIWQQTEIPIVTKDGKPAFNSPAFIEFQKKWKDWMDSGSMIMWDWGNFAQFISDGTYASYIAPDWWVSQSDMAAKNGKYRLKVRNLPVYKKGMKCGSSWGGSFLAIPKGTKDPEKIYKIMEYMQYNEAAVTERFYETGMIPPVESIYDHYYFKREDPRFNGAKLTQIQIKSGKDLTKVLMADNFWNYLGDFSQQFTEYCKENRISFDEMIEYAQNDAMKRFNAKIDPYAEITSDIANDEENENEPEEKIDEDVYDE
ncbi:MAG: carbohydrate ABC transporter substrate-binding protein [Spirochaetes bacterium]|nr:carbohydrate ABC transporter substrate-binding protein [Spirochaetota bacterium]